MLSLLTSSVKTKEETVSGREDGEVTPGAPIPLWNSQGWIGGYSEVYTPPCFGV